MPWGRIGCNPWAGTGPSGVLSPAVPGGDLPIVNDTDVILLLGNGASQPAIPAGNPFPAGVSVTVSAPRPGGSDLAIFLCYRQCEPAMAPSHVEWRDGSGSNTGRNVVAGAAYLYDPPGGASGSGFRPRLNRYPRRYLAAGRTDLRQLPMTSPHCAASTRPWFGVCWRSAGSILPRECLFPVSLAAPDSYQLNILRRFLGPQKG
jgi:hypothetical protein